MSIKDNLKNKFGDNLAMLRRLRDEIRVQIHLASMDAQDKWRELEQKLPEAESKANETGPEAMAFVSNVIRQLTDLKNKLAIGRDDDDRPSMSH